MNSTLDQILNMHGRWTFRMIGIALCFFYYLFLFRTHFPSTTATTLNLLDNINMRLSHKNSLPNDTSSHSFAFNSTVRTVLLSYSKHHSLSSYNLPQVSAKLDFRRSQGSFCHFVATWSLSFPYFLAPYFLAQLVLVLLVSRNGLWL